MKGKVNILFILIIVAIFILFFNGFHLESVVTSSVPVSRSLWISGATSILRDSLVSVDVPVNPTGKMKIDLSWQVSQFPCCIVPVFYVYNWKTSSYETFLDDSGAYSKYVNSDKQIKVSLNWKWTASDQAFSDTVLYSIDPRVEGDLDTDGIPDFSDPCPTLAGGIKDQFGNCALQLGTNQLLAVEAFGAGKTVSKTSMRYPVVAFSRLNPVIITDSSTNSVSINKQIYDDLDVGKTLQVPVTQTWSIFYVINNNGQLPTICDGAIDVNTGKCANIPTGIVFVCSQGQFDPSLGLCVVQGTVQTVCAYGRFDTVQGLCIWNPPIQAVCPSGTVYDIDSQKCTYTPTSEAVCNSGYTYNSATNKCEIYPSSMIICPPNYAYDKSSGKCVMYPVTTTICTSGTFNPSTGVCEFTPSTAAVCPTGTTYNSQTNTCQYYPSQEIICGSGGTYNTQTRTCIVNPPSQTVCPQGIFDTALQACIYSPPTVGSCIQGTYDPIKNACIIVPNIQYLCINGVYDSLTNTCKITPQTRIVCQTGYVYNSTLDKCVGLKTSPVNNSIYIVLLLVIVFVVFILKNN